MPLRDHRRSDVGDQQNDLELLDLARIGLVCLKRMVMVGLLPSIEDQSFKRRRTTRWRYGSPGAGEPTLKRLDIAQSAVTNGMPVPDVLRILGTNYVVGRPIAVREGQDGQEIYFKGMEPLRPEDLTGRIY